MLEYCCFHVRLLLQKIKAELSQGGSAFFAKHRASLGASPILAGRKEGGIVASSRILSIIFRHVMETP
jgi:hypothetical protein